MRLGMGEMLIILAVVLLVFGAQKLPQLGDALGKGIRNFKKATREALEEEIAPAVPRLPEGIPAATAAAPAAAELRS